MTQMDVRVLLGEAAQPKTTAARLDEIGAELVNSALNVCGEDASSLEASIGGLSVASLFRQTCQKDRSLLAGLFPAFALLCTEDAAIDWVLM